MKFQMKPSNKHYSIIHVDNDHEVITLTNKKKATRICNKLNKGSGFGEDIPNFFRKTA